MSDGKKAWIVAGIVGFLLVVTGFQFQTTDPNVGPNGLPVQTDYP